MKLICQSKLENGLSLRSISIRQLHVSLRFHLEPINLIIFEDLITEVGKSHLEGASCLDAFSTYPVHT